MTRSAAVVFLCALSFSAHAVADNTATHPINIPAQDLGPALDQLTRQSGTDLVYRPEQVKGLKTQGAVGEFTAQQAVTKLLVGTKLTVNEDSTGALLIAAPQASTASSARSTSDGSAQPDQSTDRSSLQLAQTTPATGPGMAAVTNDEEKKNEEEKKEILQEVVVTGTRIAGVQTIASPTLTFSREEIESTGVTTVEGFFATLPQNLNEVSVTGSQGAQASRLASSNGDFASGVSLRGLGADSTLVLLNGSRRPGAINDRVFDLSAIPLPAIERVDIVTGGDSAIYGSDAVAGVVNLVTRRDLDGFESQVSYGARDGKGGEHLEADQAFGMRGEKGGFIVAYDYSHDWPLDATYAGAVNTQPVFEEPIPGHLNLQPNSERNSVFASGHLVPSDLVEIYGDALYTSQSIAYQYDASYPGGLFLSENILRTDQYSVAPGMEIHLSDSWRATITGVAGETHHTYIDSDNQGAGTTFFPFMFDDKATLYTVSAALDGTLFQWSGVTGKSAFGVEQNWEKYSEPFSSTEGSRTTRAVFGEFLLSSVHHVDLSLAARYSHYSDFGGTFNPQVGLAWAPIKGVTLRGTYSTAFRAPDLFTLHSTGVNQATLQTVADPLSPVNGTPVLFEQGANPNLEPEKAHTWTVDLALGPEIIPKSKLELSFYNIDYYNRIDVPVPDVAYALVDSAGYPGLINRAPTAAQLQAAINASGAAGIQNNTGVPFDPATQNILDVFPNIVLFDDRYQNISTKTVRGLDLIFNGEVNAGIGTASYGLNATYFLTLREQLTPISPPIPGLNQPGKPTNFRARGQVGYSWAAVSTFAFLNYNKGYQNIITAPSTDVASWTTVDVTLRIDGSKLAQWRWLQGLVGTLSVQNLSDKRPPSVVTPFYWIGYDPANASVTGRFTSLAIKKNW